MSGRLDELIAVASGTAMRVAGWSALLRTESIHYVVATSCQIPEDVAADHAELWVHETDADRARTLLVESSRESGSFLW